MLPSYFTTASGYTRPKIGTLLSKYLSHKLRLDSLTDIQLCDTDREYQMLGTYLLLRKHWGPYVCASCVPWGPPRRGTTCGRSDRTWRWDRRSGQRVAATQGHGAVAPVREHTKMAELFWVDSTHRSTTSNTWRCVGEVWKMRHGTQTLILKRIHFIKILYTLTWTGYKNRRTHKFL